MKMIERLYKALWILLWCLIASFISIFLIEPVEAATYSNTTYLDSGENTTLFWGCGLLGGPDYNGTVICEDCESEIINYTNLTNLNLNLTCGETTSGNKGNWNYSVTCGSQGDNSSTICQYSTTLRPGHDKQYNTNNCDIDIECEEWDMPDCDDVIIERTTTMEIEIERKDNQTTVTVDGKRYDVPDFGDFSGGFSQMADCSIFYENKTDYECDFEDCNKFRLDPLFISDSFGKWTDSIKGYTEREVKLAADLSLSQDNEEVAMSEYNLCNTAKDECLEKLKVCETDYQMNQVRSINELDDAKSSLKIAKVFAWGFGILLLFSLVVNASIIIFTWKKNRR